MLHEIRNQNRELTLTLRLVWGKKEGARVTESGWELEFHCYSEDLGLFP